MKRQAAQLKLQRNPLTPGSVSASGGAEQSLLQPSTLSPPASFARQWCRTLQTVQSSGDFWRPEGIGLGFKSGSWETGIPGSCPSGSSRPGSSVSGISGITSPGFLSAGGSGSCGFGICGFPLSLCSKWECSTICSRDAGGGYNRVVDAVHCPFANTTVTAQCPQSSGAPPQL